MTGFIVTDRFHQLVGSMVEFDAAASPPEILPVLETAFADRRRARDATGRARPPRRTRRRRRRRLRRDRLYSRAMHELAARVGSALRRGALPGLDTVGHYYLRYAQPRVVRRRRRTRSGGASAQVLDRYYAFIDGEIGAALDALGAGRSARWSCRASACSRSARSSRRSRGCCGDPDVSGTHERAPDGFLLAYGTAVRARPPASAARSSTSRRRSCISSACRSAATWTATRAPISSRRAFTAERPIAFIPSYSRSLTATAARFPLAAVRARLHPLRTL